MAMQERPRAAGGTNAIVAIATSALFLLYLAWVSGSWVVALVVLVGLVVHEGGHALAMTKAGCGPVRMIFIPFLGGLAVASRPPRTQFVGALIALAGPAVGITMVVPALTLFYVTGNEGWVIGAFFIAILNILNLFPAPPLDGSHIVGPVLARINPHLERYVAVGLGAVAALWAAASGSYLIAFFIGLSTFSVLRFGVQRGHSTPLEGNESALSLGLYLAVATLCLLALFAVSGGQNPFLLLQAYLTL